jgi:hypothetical protein
VKTVLLLLLAGTLAACSTEADRQRLAAMDDAKCRSYGGELGTPAYVQCRAQLDAARTQALATLAAAPPAPVWTPAPIVVPPVR